MIKYIGSKRVLVPAILDLIGRLPEVRTVVDLFSGTSRVGHALKGAGYRVLANDHNAYAETLARCYVEADREQLAKAAEGWISELNSLPGEPGYFTRTFCEESRFFRAKNGARVDAIRERIAAAQLEPELEAVLLVSLMEAADRVDSTTGVQMAYLKQWAPRAFQDLELRLPALLPRAQGGKGRAFRLDACDAAARLEADVAYLDPPYNQHKYLGNYHIWESLVTWDKPEAYGVARKRTDCKTRRSDFNSSVRITDALRTVVERLAARFLVVSFSDEGFLSRGEMEALLGTRGEVLVLEHPHRRYVGAQIGIYNPSGDKVGQVSHLRNKEYLFLVVPRGFPLNAGRLAPLAAARC